MGRRILCPFSPYKFYNAFILPCITNHLLVFCFHFPIFVIFSLMNMLLYQMQYIRHFCKRKAAFSKKTAASGFSPTHSCNSFFLSSFLFLLLYFSLLFFLLFFLFYTFSFLSVFSSITFKFPYSQLPFHLPPQKPGRS